MTRFRNGPTLLKQLLHARATYRALTAIDLRTEKIAIANCGQNRGFTDKTV